MNLSASQISTFALAVAEAAYDRHHWLEKLKEVRRRKDRKTAEELLVITDVYTRSKRRFRECLALYVAARQRLANDKDAGSVEESVLSRLRMDGWDV